MTVDLAIDSFDRMVAQEANSPGAVGAARGATQEVETPMPDKRNEPRKYALTRIGKGDYLLPSNDGTRLWRIYSYEEDGSAEWSDGTKIKGTFWACARHVDPLPSIRHTVDWLDWTNDWEPWAMIQRTRQDAIAEALRA